MASSRPEFAASRPAFTTLDNSQFADDIIKLQREKTEYDLGFAHIILGQIADQLFEFQKGLNDNEEVGALIAAFGRTIEIRIEDIVSVKPYLLVLYGRILESNEPVRLVQHVMQTNIL